MSAAIRANHVRDGEICPLAENRAGERHGHISPTFERILCRRKRLNDPALGDRAATALANDDIELPT